MIRRSDRVAEVLRRDERLIEAFVAASPVFERLRNPIMRKTMGRLATVEQAARVAGLDPDALIELLNRARSDGASPVDPLTKARGSLMTPTDQQEAPAVHTDAPLALSSIPPASVVDLDVREDLRNGREPFSRIMAARRDVPPGGALRLRAIFEPVPLYAVMEKQGFDHWTEELAPDDWCVWFYPAQAAADVSSEDGSRAPAGDRAHSPPSGADNVVVLDVRGMEPPEPMVRTLAALEELQQGKTLLQINDRVPQFLLPKLEELGFSYQIREQEAGPVRIFIRRGG